MKTLLVGKELNLTACTVDSLNSGDSQPRWHVFSKENSGLSENGNFQVYSCNEDSSGQVIIALDSFHFQTSKTSECWF